MAHAAAAPALFDTLRDPVGAFLRLLTGALAHFVDGARSDIERVLRRYLFQTVDTSVPGSREFTARPSLRRLNLGLALACDVLLAAVVVYASLRSLFERTIRARYTLKAVLPRVLWAIVPIHFSLLLMQLVIDLDNALCSVALSLGDTLSVDGLPWSPTLSPASVTSLQRSQDLFHSVFAAAVVVGLVILVLAYVLRYALLGVLVVLAPLAALCSILPETRGHTATWMRLFTVTVFMQAVQLLVLRVAMVMSVDGDGAGGLVSSLYALATLFLMLKVPGALNTAAHLETKAHTLGHHVERSIVRAVHHATHHRTVRSRSAA